eukprot:IDg23277t1
MKKVNPQPKPANERRTRSTSGLSTQRRGKDLSTYLTDVERAAAQNAAAKAVARSTAQWTQQHAQAVVAHTPTLPPGIELPVQTSEENFGPDKAVSSVIAEDQ